MSASVCELLGGAGYYTVQVSGDDGGFHVLDDVAEALGLAPEDVERHTVAVGMSAEDLEGAPQGARWVGSDAAEVALMMHPLPPHKRRAWRPWFDHRARAAADFAERFVMDLDRGVLSGHGLYVPAFGKGQYMRTEHQLEVERLARGLAGLEAEEVGFAMSETGSTWAMLVRPTPLPGETLEVRKARVRRLEAGLEALLQKLDTPEEGEEP